MLDESLPTFYFKASADSVKHDASLYLSQYGHDATPAYKLRHPDPTAPDSKNRYAVALSDIYNPDILFGEVLLVPEWSQPRPTQEEIRLNGGIPPAPQPILPTEFTVQLYNPDQQVVVKQHPSSWNTSTSWDFSMPQQTFRQPSTSALDRTQSDPTASDTTPTIDFKWKKDGMLSRDLTCSLSGKSQNPDGSKRKHKEPDIAVAFFRSLREVTIYEPNLSRVDMEDLKGLEVVMLLSAAVIKDVYFGQMKEVFNISEAARPKGPKVPELPPRQDAPHGRVPNSQVLPPRQPQPQTQPTSHKPATSHGPALHLHTTDSRPPPTDPRSQWELDAETARLRKQVEAEERERRKAEQAETKRVKKMFEEEERAARRRQAEIEKETDRLRREYVAEQRRIAQQGPRSNLPPSHSAPIPQQPAYPHPPPAQPSYYGYSQYPPSQFQQGPAPSGPYLQTPAPGYASSSGFLAGPAPAPTVKPKRSSFFGMRSLSDGDGHKLTKKPSAIF